MFPLYTMNINCTDTYPELSSCHSKKKMKAVKETCKLQRLLTRQHRKQTKLPGFIACLDAHKHPKKQLYKKKYIKTPSVYFFSELHRCVT